MQLDDHLKRLLRELGHAINDTVSESDRITEAISGVRAAGYDIVLKLDATIGLARREQSSGLITSNDRRFLESLHIQVDQDVLEEEKHETKTRDHAPGLTLSEIAQSFVRRTEIRTEVGRSLRRRVVFSKLKGGTFSASPARRCWPFLS